MSAVRTHPRLRIVVDGAAMAPELIRTIATIRVQQRLSLPTLCELTFLDPPDVDLAAIRPGTRLQVRVEGTGTGDRPPLFAGELTAREHVYEPERGRELRLRAYDLLHRLRKKQTVSAFAEVTVSDLAEELLRDIDLSLNAEEPGPFFSQLIQHQQSDLELLTTIAGQCGLYLTVRDSVAHLLPLSGIGDATGLHLGRKLLEARVEVNGDPACRSVEAAGWRTSHADSHSGRAARPRSGRDVRAEVSPSDVGASGDHTLLDVPASSAEQAEAFAQAELDRRIAREVVLWGVAEGDPALRPGAKIDVTGLERELEGRYVLAAVTHTIDNALGYLTEFSTDPPAPPVRSQGAIVAPGVVTRVDDPDEQARVRVSLPTYGGVETDWIPVMCAGAGEDKGFIALPDVDDNVIVLCAQSNPARGIVLGGLYGTGGKPDSGVVNGAVRRYSIRTAGGQRVTFDDEHGRLRVENRAGSYIELGPDEARLHAATDLLIEAPGNELVIQAATIDFRSA